MAGALLRVLIIMAIVPAFARAQPAPPPPATPTPPTPPTPPSSPAPEPPPIAEPAPPANDTSEEATSPDEEHGLTSDDASASPDDDKDKKKRKGKITYKHHWVRFELPHHTVLKLRLYLEPMFRYSHVSPANGMPAPDDTVDWFIRRGRVGFDVRAESGIGFRLEQSVKNNHAEIHNMFGYYKPPGHNLEFQVGFIKAPGGLERDTFSFEQEFNERSVITFYNRDHEVGVKVEGTSDDDTLFWAAAVTRDPPPLEGGDPEDSPMVPMGVEAEDIYRAGSKWASEGRFGFTPSDAFEVSVNAGVRIRPDEPDFGEIAVEPYDTTFLTNSPYKGTMVRAGADAAVSQPHWKLTAEAAVRRDGEGLAYPDGTIASQTALDEHLNAEAAYVIAAWTPNGEFGKAIDAAPLRKGWALTTRLMAERINPPARPIATYASAEFGWHWEAARHLRVQVDMAIEKFGQNDITLLNENRGATRLYAQSWFVFRL